MPKVREVIRRLEAEGWQLARMEGDHRQYKHRDFPGRRVTVAGKPGSDIPPGTWNSIQKQAGWREEDRT
jgi:predicted RNA binding protein YcfA (HicA-like mRNA interferase family)